MQSLKSNGKYKEVSINPTKRLAIMLRDNLQCYNCRGGIEEGTVLELDHVVARSSGGTNDPKNLITCCNTCNSSRGNRSLIKFTSYAGYIRVRKAIRRSYPKYRRLAQRMLADRGATTAAQVYNYL